MARCSGTKNEPFIPSLDGAGISLECRVVRSLFEYRKQTHGQTGYSATGAGADCALLCAGGKIARLALGSLACFVRFHVAFWLASRSNLSRAGVISPAVLGR